MSLGYFDLINSFDYFKLNICSFKNGNVTQNCFSNCIFVNLLESNLMKHGSNITNDCK